MKSDEVGNFLKHTGTISGNVKKFKLKDRKGKIEEMSTFTSIFGQV